MDDRLSNIKHVAIYLRKSRDEENRIEDGHIAVLDKHRARCIEYAKLKNWKYDEYAEIGSSETIRGRKVFTELLEKVAMGLYDAILAVDLDRVTKGDRTDVGLIHNVLHEANIPVVTPDGGYFAFNEDDYYTDFKLLSSRIEQVNTKRRMRHGKVSGVKVKGNWVNGPAPYGYRYNHTLKKLEKDAEQFGVFRFIVESYLNGQGIWKITQTLRAQQVKPAKGRTWHDNTILRMLKNPVYMGKVVYGKSRGSGHRDRGGFGKVEQIPPSEWLVYDDAHEPLVTPEEFHDIQLRLIQNSRFPVHTKKSKQVLSGLLFCGKCGRAMTCNRRALKSGDKMIVKKCRSLSDTGEVCGNPGIEVDVLYQQIELRLLSYEQELMRHRDSKNDRAIKLLEKQIVAHKRGIETLESAFERIRDMYRLGATTREEFMDDMAKNRQELEDKQKELRNLEMQYHYKSAEERQDAYDRFTVFRDAFSFYNIPAEKANNHLKSIIDKIYYSREGDAIDLDIQFL